MANPVLFDIGEEIVDLLLGLKTESGEPFFKDVVNGFVVPEKSRPADFPLACVFYGDGAFGGGDIQFNENVEVDLNIVAYFHIPDPRQAQLTMMKFHEKVMRAVNDKIQAWENRDVFIKPSGFGFGDVLRRWFGIEEIPLLPPFYGVHINLKATILRSAL